jgi:hypothetical protein
MNDFQVLDDTQRAHINDCLNGILNELSTSEISTSQYELIELYINKIKHELYLEEK